MENFSGRVIGVDLQKKHSHLCGKLTVELPVLEVRRPLAKGWVRKWILGNASDGRAIKFAADLMLVGVSK